MDLSQTPRFPFYFFCCPLLLPSQANLCKELTKSPALCSAFQLDEFILFSLFQIETGAKRLQDLPTIRAITEE